MSDDSSDFSSSGSSSEDSFAEGGKGNAESKEAKQSESESSSEDSDSMSDSDQEFQASQDQTTDKMESKITQVKNAHHDEAMELSMSQSTVATNAEGESAPAAAGAGTDHKSLENQPYDEAVELSSSSDEAQTPAAKGTAQPAKAASDSDSDSDSSSTDSEASSPKAKAAQPMKPIAQKPVDDSDSDSDSDSTTDSSDSDAPTGGKRKNYDNLRVSAEIQELFGYIKAYEPPQLELNTQLKCFIPEYIPSIGNIDPFIKVARPDGKPDELGLSVLDEPHSQQSDSTVLEMQLRAVSKKSNLKEMAVACIENAEKDTGRISRWIENIEELHRSKPPPGVAYTEAMPDIEQLMQVWPPEFEEALRSLKIPPAELDVSLEEYAQICCNLLDIPMHKSAVQSLHVFFTLYTEFSANQHFIVGAADSAKAAMQANADAEAEAAENSQSQTLVLDNSADFGGGFESRDGKTGDDDDDDGKRGRDEGKDDD